MNWLAVWNGVMASALIGGAVVLIRNRIVFQSRMKALGIVSNHAQQMIKQKRHEWLRCYELLESFGSYNEMVFDLTAWRFNSLYPGLEDRLRAL